MGKRGPKARSFWGQVEFGTGCWEWQGTRFGNGYGRTGEGRGAHRVAYELTVGPIPDGLVVMHTCDNPPCVRPDHLSVGTPADNLADMVAKGRAMRGTANPAARLTERNVRYIRIAVAGGNTIAQTARDLGVAEQTVRSVVQGRTWRWVE